MKARHVRRSRRGEEGQVITWFVAMSVITLAIVALGVDLGFLFHARRIAQNAADGGALAGASELPGCGTQDADPLLVSEDYAGQNLAGKVYTVSDQYVGLARYGTYTVDDPVFAGESTFDTVYQKVVRQQSMIFARFIGVGNKSVPAEAEAACLSIKSGNICPFWIAGDPSQPVVREDPDDPTSNITEAYGLTMGAIYSMKFNAAQGTHRGALSAPPGDSSSTDDWRDFIASGCEESKSSDDPFYTGNGEEVPNKPGDYGNPFLSALEGGGGTTPSTGLYGIEKTDSTLYPNKHLDCNIKITFDPATGDGLTAQNYGYVGGVWQPVGTPLNLVDPITGPANRQTVVDWIDAKTVPSLMAADFNSPCGGSNKQGEVPEVIHPATQGRLMHVAMVDKNDPCVADASNPAGCDIDVLGILTMYVVCWSNQEEIPNNDDSRRCIPDTEPGNPNRDTNISQQSIFASFANFTQGNLIGGDGVSQCEICPKRVRLVR